MWSWCFVASTADEEEQLSSSLLFDPLSLPEFRFQGVVAVLDGVYTDDQLIHLLREADMPYQVRKYECVKPWNGEVDSGISIWYQMPDGKYQMFEFSSNGQMECSEVVDDDDISLQEMVMGLQSIEYH